MKQLASAVLAFQGRLSFAIAVAICFLTGSGPATADPIAPAVRDQSTADVAPIPSVASRFAADSSDEVPDFQKHVVPLLGRLGCNGRACHGSFQGRGGFQLSLFGYDFASDHQALLAENTGRVDPDDVDESLILAKPIDADMHEGGKRMEKDGWQYQVLRNWIAAGAEYATGETQTLEKLEILPAEIQFADASQSVQLTAIAHWADGTVEDVTPLCRFSTNDDAIARINEHGLVQSGESGDTHVVVYYDNAVVPIPVLQPLSGVSPKANDSIANEQPSTPVDRLVKQKLDKLGVVASDRCTDAEFIRRVSLDLTGVLPSAGAVRAFLADTSNDKRARLVEDLLESPGYAAWWATRLSDWTGNNAEQLNNVLPVRNISSKLWYEWLRDRLEKNVAYDQIIEGIVTAETRNPGESYREYCESMTKICTEDPQAYAQREGLPLYWSRRNFQKPEDRAIGFAYTFLGVRIECAQCHKHPFDQWSKQDFDDFSKLFSTVRAGNANLVAPESKKEHEALLEKLTGGKKLRGGDLRRAIAKAARTGEVVPFGELFVREQSPTPAQRKKRAQAKRAGRKLPPLRVPTGTILGQEDELKLSADPRPALMNWLRDPANPYFAKAIVNRVWSNYFGIGIVDPTDDMNLANPPSNAALLDYLANSFVEHDFDLKWLHREIVLTDTYQRSAETNATNVNDRKNFSHHVPRRLPAEIVFDMVALATGSTEKAAQMRSEMDQMAIADGKPRTRNQSNFALEVFGQSIRETNCDCDRSDAPSLLQSIYLRNDQDMYRQLSDRDGWVAEACKNLGLTTKNDQSDRAAQAKQRSADKLRVVAVRRIKEFTKLPEQRQQQTRRRVEDLFEKLTQRLGDDYRVPSLDQLLKNPNSWKQLEPAESNSKPEAKVDRNERLMQVVQDAYLRTLSRFPDANETSIAIDFVSNSEDPAKGIEGLLWALVNTKEFIISH
jgi:hypothetical protein